MRTKQAIGRRLSGGPAPWAGTLAAAVTLVAATGVGVAHAAPARPSFDYLGEFANVKDAPPGTPAITGIAAMVVTRHGTTTSISVAGLDPNAVYIADVHST